jgi:hypothetical protein
VPQYAFHGSYLSRTSPRRPPTSRSTQWQSNPTCNSKSSVCYFLRLDMPKKTRWSVNMCARHVWHTCLLPNCTRAVTCSETCTCALNRAPTYRQCGQLTQMLSPAHVDLQKFNCWAGLTADMLDM